MPSSDFLIIGGGVIGINIARRLKQLYPDTTVTVLEKEAHCGAHASGRNSGVLHAGFYYTPDSLKAKFTRIGNRRLTEYCEASGIPMNKCGKLVVAKNADELSGLDELFRRARVNEIQVQEVSAQEAKAIEPRVKTYERALYSPTTSTVDPKLVLKQMTKDAQGEGVHIHCGVRYQSRHSDGVQTDRDLYQARYVVNAAGLFADTIARDYGFSQEYKILPFKGLYLYSNEPPGSFRTNVYPVPDLKNPFLGVHVTVTAEKKAKIGPTAIPVLWREQYGGLANFDLGQFCDLSVRQLQLVIGADFDFKKLAVQEIRKYSRSHLVSLLSDLVEGVRPEHYQTWGVPGIRAQLVHTKTKKLEMDFVVQGDDRSLHVLNAISPGFTCSLPFADYVCEKIQTFTNIR
ncbi:MAG: L-2-hydroxyglutarate oxidase [Nitrospirales bacterium]|nr:L-2-hydroxyglutarate oxidase [Nitrospira sp.]MCB9711271.1 L-2-hydroxyglutarate oxidase [Nitrospiraceae bacterium]MDR4486723.1 L-2-hydroxyglutarate oxidase [Nitrospirales bacterium]